MTRSRVGGVFPVVVALLAAMLVHPPAAPAMCTPMIVHDGVYYGGVRARSHVALGGRVRAAFPGCHDVITAPRPQPRPVWLRRIVGVSPRVALADPGRPQMLYIAAGLFPQVKTFPLHGALYRTPSTPRECLRAHPQIALRIVGVVRRAPLPFSLLEITTQRGTKRVFVDATTKLRYPATRRLRTGMRVEVIAGICGRKTVALTIARR